MKPNIVVIIPARGGSKRLKNKNLKIFRNKPLIFWSINAAKKSKLVDDVYVTSENENILKISQRFNAKTIKRPKNLSNDIIMPDQAIKHAYIKIKKSYDYIVSLQPTSPIRSSTDIDEAIKKIIKTKADSLTSVFKTHAFIWKKKGDYFEPTNYDYNNRPRSQDCEFYQENGSILITKPKILLKKNNRLGGKVSVYIMNFWKSFDIDNIEDFKLIEFLTKYKKKK